MNIGQYMRAVDIGAFKQAARFFNCIIMVRRLNPASLPYIGKPGYMPKTIYCKAKTAKYNVSVPGTGQVSQVAGLVVDPTLPGMQAAFDNFTEAKSMWEKFLAKLAVNSLDIKDLYHRLPVERGGFYTVQHDKHKPYYGALLFCPFIPADIHHFKLETFYLSQCLCIHGDFDLYALIPADEREMRIVNQGILLGQRNYYSPLLEPVRNYINQRIGSPMVQHGSQENIGHSDDTVDIFWPDGRITQRSGMIQVMQFYQQVLGNRTVGPDNQAT